MNHFQYFFELSKEKELKLEFVYYPFPRLGKIKKIDSLKIEPLIDIAAAKTLSAYQRQETKDAYDLFILLKEKHFFLNDLIKGVEKKFGETIDPNILLAKLTETIKNFQSLKPLIYDKKYTISQLSDFFQSEFDEILRRKL